MSESSTSPGPEDDSWKEKDGWESFDVKEFARQTMFSIESRDEDDHVDQLRLIRLEEIVAARWPRSWLLRRRLAREIRASVAMWDEAHIPRGDFLGRRLEWAMQQSIALRESRRSHRAERQAEDDTGQAAESEQQGAADPGEGFLP